MFRVQYQISTTARVATGTSVYYSAAGTSVSTTVLLVLVSLLQCCWYWCLYYSAADTSVYYSAAGTSVSTCTTVLLVLVSTTMMLILVSLAAN